MTHLLRVDGGAVRGVVLQPDGVVKRPERLGDVGHVTRREVAKQVHRADIADVAVAAVDDALHVVRVVLAEDRGVGLEKLLHPLPDPQERPRRRRLRAQRGRGVVNGVS